MSFQVWRSKSGCMLSYSKVFAKWINCFLSKGSEHRPSLIVLTIEYGMMSIFWVHIVQSHRNVCFSVAALNSEVDQIPLNYRCFGWECLPHEAHIPYIEFFNFFSLGMERGGILSYLSKGFYEFLRSLDYNKLHFDLVCWYTLITNKSLGPLF